MIGSREITQKDRKITMIAILVSVTIFDVYSLYNMSFPKNFGVIIISLFVLEFFGLLTFYDFFWLLRVIYFYRISKKGQTTPYENFLLRIFNDTKSKDKLLKKLHIMQITDFNLSYFKHSVVILNGVHKGFVLKYRITSNGIYFCGKALKRTRKYYNGSNEAGLLMKFVLTYLHMDHIIFSKHIISVDEDIIALIISLILDKKVRIDNFLNKKI